MAHGLPRKIPEVVLASSVISFEPVMYQSL